MSDDSPLCLRQLLDRGHALLDRLEACLPRPFISPDWSQALAWHYRRQRGSVQLIPVPEPTAIPLTALQAVDTQRARLLQNLSQFAQGLPANNVLLTGARGTGKSSLVKACWSALAPQGVYLVEVDKANLCDLPELLALMAGQASRFLVFCDDLSFDAEDGGYKALKSALDGSIEAASDKVLIVATSNRRHLMPEAMKDNLTPCRSEDGELHPAEAVEEKISLSERFGLWLSFYPFSQREYVLIVEYWLQHFGVPEAHRAQALQEALVWAIERGARSGRIAYQFAKDCAGRHPEAARRVHTAQRA